MKFDKYDLYARILPALLTVIPLILFHHFYINSELSGFLTKVAAIRWVSELSMPVVFIISFAFANRTMSKMVIENRNFKGEMRLPTTNILLFITGYYSDHYLNKIHNKIYHDFGIKLLSKVEESRDEEEARKRVMEAVSLIIEKVKNGRLVLQRNIEYGFFRNLIGGSIFAVVFSLLSASFFYFFYPNNLALVLSIIGFLGYGLILLFHKSILNWLGDLYAKKLIQEYMALT